MTEIWRDIKGYEGYQVSNCGRVRSSYKGGRILKPNIVRCGYSVVALYRDKKQHYTTVHRLVALAFIPNPDNKPQVNHIDGDKTNNHVNNLEWVTAAENIHHADALGLRGRRSPRAKLTDEQVRFIRDNPDNLTQEQLAQMFNVGETVIGDAQRGKTYKNAGGRIRTKKPPNPQRVPDNIREQIRAEYQFGVPGHGGEILAKKYGIGRRTVWRIVHEN